VRTAPWSENVSVLDRLTAILDAFATADADDLDEGLSVTELARRARLPKSTASRITAELAAEGYLDRIGGRLHLGLRFYELGQSAERPRRLRRAAWRPVTALREATASTVLLVVPAESDVVVIARARGVGPSPVAQIGTRVPRTGTSLGVAIDLALRSPAPASAAVDDIAVFAVGHGGELCVCAPIHDADEPVAAICAIAPAEGADPARLAGSVRAAAAATRDRLPG